MAIKRTPLQQQNYDNEIKNEQLGFAKAYAALHPGWVPTGTPVLQPTADPTYVSQQAQGTKSLNDTYATLGVGVNPDGTINYQPTGAYGGSYLGEAQASGFDEAGNPITNPADPRFNPFSALKQFQDHFEETKRGTVNNYAANGQLYSGALINAQNTNQHNYDVGYDSQSRGAKSVYSSLVANALSGKNTFDANNITNLAAAGDRQTALHANDPFNPAPPQPPAAPAPTAKPKVLGPYGRFNQRFMSNLSKGR